MTIQAGWSMTDDDAVVFEQFYRNTLMNGTRSFAIELNHFGLRRDATCFFLEPPTSSIRSRIVTGTGANVKHRWDVVASLLVDPLNNITSPII